MSHYSRNTSDIKISIYRSYRTKDAEHNQIPKLFYRVNDLEGAPLEYTSFKELVENIDSDLIERYTGKERY